MAVAVDILESQYLPLIAKDLGMRTIIALRDEENSDQILSEWLGLPGASLKHLVPKRNLRFVGSIRYEAKMGFASQIQAVMQIVGSIPGAEQVINIPKLIMKLMRVAAPDEAESLMNNALQAIGQSQAFAAASGGAPGGGVAPATKPSSPQAQPIQQAPQPDAAGF